LKDLRAAMVRRDSLAGCQAMVPDAKKMSWTIFTLHAGLQSGVFSEAQAGDRDLPPRLTLFFVSFFVHSIISVHAALGWEL